MSHNCICGQPAPDSWLCRTHDAELEHLVTELPALVGYLDDTIGRQVRFSSGRIGGRPAETPVAINEAAAEVGKALRSELVRIVRHLVESRGVSPIRMPSDSLASIATWIGMHVESIRLDETSGETLTSLRAITRRVLRVIDRPADKLYAGICSMVIEAGECPTELYAERGALFIVCRGCGFRHDVEHRRDVLRAAARDTMMTIPELKVALPEVLGVPINHSTLRSWKHRKRIVAHGVSWSGEETFRIGDILDIIVQGMADQGEAS